MRGGDWGGRDCIAAAEEPGGAAASPGRPQPLAGRGSWRWCCPGDTGTPRPLRGIRRRLALYSLSSRRRVGGQRHPLLSWVAFESARFVAALLRLLKPSKEHVRCPVKHLSIYFYFLSHYLGVKTGQTWEA